MNIINSYCLPIVYACFRSLHTSPLWKMRPRTPAQQRQWCKTRLYCVNDHAVEGIRHTEQHYDPRGGHIRRPQEKYETRILTPRGGQIRGAPRVRHCNSPNVHQPTHYSVNLTTLEYRHWHLSKQKSEPFHDCFDTLISTPRHHTTLVPTPQNHEYYTLHWCLRTPFPGQAHGQNQVSLYHTKAATTTKQNVGVTVVTVTFTAQFHMRRRKVIHLSISRVLCLNNFRSTLNSFTPTSSLNPSIHSKQ